MELWIRSQDRNNLIKVYDIWIDDTDMVDKGYVYIMANSNFSFELGVYQTKKRALEILDEIKENIVKQGQTIILTDERGIPNGSKFFSYVYEMPEE